MQKLSLEEILKFKEILDVSNTILLMGHENPDGDAICSCFGLKNILESLGKNVTICLDKMPENFKMFEEYDSVFGYEELKSKKNIFDLCICVDLNNKSRLDKRVEFLENCKQIVVIDHHITETSFGNLNLIVEGESSTCQIIYEIFEQIAIKLVNTPKVIHPLITGIITDTGGFRFPTTNEKTLEIAKIAKGLGIEFHKIYNELILSMSKNEFELRKIAINNLKFYANDKIAVTYLDYSVKEYLNAKPGETESIVGNISNLRTVRISVFLREVESDVNVKKYKVSIRSKNLDTVDISKSFGGGGHKEASGFTISGNLDEIILEVVKKCEIKLMEENGKF